MQGFGHYFMTHDLEISKASFALIGWDRMKWTQCLTMEQLD